MTRSSWAVVRIIEWTCSTARISVYWAAAARATAISVSPVESEIMWRWKNPSRLFTDLSPGLWTG
jgi:hypothetical protein